MRVPVDETTIEPNGVLFYKITVERLTLFHSGGEIVSLGVDFVDSRLDREYKFYRLDDGAYRVEMWDFSLDVLGYRTWEDRVVYIARIVSPALPEWKPLPNSQIVTIHDLERQIAVATGKLAGLYLEHARALHAEWRERLDQLAAAIVAAEEELATLKIRYYNGSLAEDRRKYLADSVYYRPLR